MEAIKLVKRCQKGEKQAFNEVIQLYSPYVSKFLLKLTMDETLCEDLTQETFIKLIRGIDKFDVKGKAQFTTYIITIAKNCYIDYLRRNGKTIVNIDDVNVADKMQVEDLIVNKMEVNDIIKCIDSLPPEQGQAIKMKYLEELTLKEIAEIFKTKPMTIKSRIHSGIVKLRKKLLIGGSINE